MLLLPTAYCFSCLLSRHMQGDHPERLVTTANGMISEVFPGDFIGKFHPSCKVGRDQYLTLQCLA